MKVALASRIADGQMRFQYKQGSPEAAKRRGYLCSQKEAPLCKWTLKLFGSDDDCASCNKYPLYFLPMLVARQLQRQVGGKEQQSLPRMTRFLMVGPRDENDPSTQKFNFFPPSYGKE
jgi:hypothetical protein